MKLSLEQNIKYAAQLGSEAFHNGIKAIPALDRKFMEFAKSTSSQSTPSFSYLLAWNHGWRDANALANNGPLLTESSIESYKSFLNNFKDQNPSLIESIQNGFNAIFENFYQELISLGDLKSRLDEVNPEKWDTTQCKIFKEEWNKRYPSYPVSIKGNQHDFGTFYDIKISEDLFDKSFDDITNFPNGIEQASSNLADELHLDS